MHRILPDVPFPHHSSRSPPPPMLHPADPTPPPAPAPRTPTKRSRKAINCEPCRASKLKCDRGRPCSSCVLRGTASLCYQGDRRQDGHDGIKQDDGSRVDPHQEIARIRHSLSLVEAHIARSPSWLPNGAPHAAAAAFSSADHSPRSSAPLKQESFDPSLPHSTSDVFPSILTQFQFHSGQAGLFAGATSPATHFASFCPEQETHEQDPHGTQSIVAVDPGPSAARDFDLLALLPEISVVDGLLSHYFESCQWEYRYLHHHSFTSAWTRFKSNGGSDRLVLATVFLALAIAIQFLPSRHHLLDSISESPVRHSENFYNFACTTLQRYHSERRAYSLEFVELLLLQSHYLSIVKDQCEDLWNLRGELVSIGIAMGLHRDPGSKTSRDLAERRRWAWWNIMITERWQAFILGRPLAICNHHFDTQFPSSFDSSYDQTGRLHFPHVHFFRLAEILGDVMEDAVSVRRVPYDRVIAQDKALERWFQTLPPELDFDDYHLASALSSSVLATRRAGMQSLCLRVLFFHVRFTLHRPYASSGSTIHDPRWQQSVEAAIDAADKLTQLVATAGPDLLANATLAVVGHLHWGPVHAFSAALFFVAQLLVAPDQPAGNLFRANVKRTIGLLEHLRGVSAAEKALTILQNLMPLIDEPDAEKKRPALEYVRRLPFPCFDPPGFAQQHHSGSGGRGCGSGAASASPTASISPGVATPVAGATTLPPPQQATPPQAQHQQLPPPQHHHQHSQPPPTRQQQQQHPPYGQQRHVYEGAYAAEESVWGSAAGTAPSAAGMGVDSGDWAHYMSSTRTRPDGLA